MSAATGGGSGAPLRPREEGTSAVTAGTAVTSEEGRDAGGEFPVAFVLAGGYLGGTIGRAELVALHRSTLAAAASC